LTEMYFGICGITSINKKHKPFWEPDACFTWTREALLCSWGHREKILHYRGLCSSSVF